MTFHVGQKVVCVGSKWFAPPLAGEIFPSVGEVYTIGAIVDWGDDGPLGLQFHELRNPPLYNGQEADFRADNFRPIAKRKTDTSIFTAMLKPSKVEA